ncbi:stage V sporulation protein AE [Halonatronum saccharophilum]|uniref:stage V sporulation protein AE n=1 Tax=Halonatronum saccharophilum TaxID=150060 RepID=UPI000485B1CA|nr:stage V sporulation protein AE [Halonatronum saccharophilum]
MKRVIIVTDGDNVAKRAVEKATENLDLRVISRSAGNPTPCDGEKVLDMIESCPKDPVVIMVDDQGYSGCGKGEQVMEKVVQSENIEVLGIVAVASNTPAVSGVKPNFSITRDGNLVNLPVDKYGTQEGKNHQILEGDTVDIINEFSDLMVVGIGDLGKMSGKDSFEVGAPITTKAIEEILKRSGVKE